MPLVKYRCIKSSLESQNERKIERRSKRFERLRVRNPQCRKNLSGADFSEHTKSLSVLSNISYAKAVIEFFFRVL